MADKKVPVNEKIYNIDTEETKQMKELRDTQHELMAELGRIDFEYEKQKANIVFQAHNISKTYTDIAKKIREKYKIDSDDMIADINYETGKLTTVKRKDITPTKEKKEEKTTEKK